MSKQCIAMLLAGGRGSRLKSLTEHLAKPAVPFGGKYRIIDFVLSNCRNSNIDTVGVLTQYQPHLLHNYIGNGEAWGLNHRGSGVSILPPYLSNDRERWYEGTAHAIYQNLDYIDHYNPDYVLVLSGDHIYKMDYQQMLQQHIKTGAEATIATVQVPVEQAFHFGIISADEKQRIFNFEEKPSYPKSTRASMGVYVFNWQVLRDYLKGSVSSGIEMKDFGKDVIPRMLFEQRRLYTYDFFGYWKDVGTVHSYWEANMDLLTKQNNVLYTDRAWPIYTVEQCIPPFFLDDSGHVRQSIIADGSDIAGDVDHSVLSYGVTIGKGSVIQNSVILPNTKIGNNVFIKNMVVGSQLTIQSGSVFQPSSFIQEAQLIDEDDSWKEETSAFTSHLHH